MTSRGEVYFAMYGDDFEPNDVSNHVGLSATDVLRKGARRPDVPIPRYSSWQVSTGEVESDVVDVYGMSDRLVSQLAPYVAKIIEAKTMFNLTCVLHIETRWGRVSGGR